MHFRSPYLIERRLGKVAYPLKLPEGSRIHPIFHVSLPKKKNGESCTPSSTFRPVTDEGQLALFPEYSILETRWVKHGSKLTEESLVKLMAWFSS